MDAILPCWKRRERMRGAPRKSKGDRFLPVFRGLLQMEIYKRGLWKAESQQLRHVDLLSRKFYAFQIKTILINITLEPSALIF